MVRSTRIGDIGCDGPKSYSVSEESKTTLAGPGHSMARTYSPATRWVLPATSTRPLVARLT